MDEKVQRLIRQDYHDDGSLLFLLSLVNHQAHVHQTREGLIYITI